MCPLFYVFNQYINEKSDTIKSFCGDYYNDVFDPLHDKFIVNYKTIMVEPNCH